MNYYSLLIALLFSLLFWWRFNVIIYPTTTLTLGAQTFQVEIAETLRQKSRGLSYRASLAANQGMLFVYNSPVRPGFWMKGMNFPLDFIWIKDNQIVDLTENASPASFWQGQTFRPASPVTHVLEVPAGTISALNITTSTPVSIRRY